MNEPDRSETAAPAVGSPLDCGVVPLVERLRTDVLWLRRRGNDTIARDCQEAVDELEMHHALVVAAEKALAQLRNPEWGKWRYMEGSDVYDDLRDAATPLEVALAALRHNVEVTWSPPCKS